MAEARNSERPSRGLTKLRILGRAPMEVFIWILVIAATVFAFSHFYDTYETHNQNGLHRLNTERYQDAYQEFGRALNCATEEMDSEQIRSALEKQTLAAFIMKDDGKFKKLTESLKNAEILYKDQADAATVQDATAAETRMLLQSLDNMNAGEWADLEERILSSAGGFIDEGETEEASKLLSKLLVRYDQVYCGDNVRLLEPLILLTRAKLVAVQKSSPGSFARAGLIEESRAVLERARHLLANVDVTGALDQKLNRVRVDVYDAYLSAAEGNIDKAKTELAAVNGLLKQKNITLDEGDDSIRADANATCGDAEAAAEIYEQVLGRLSVENRDAALRTRDRRILTGLYIGPLHSPSRARHLLKGLLDSETSAAGGSWKPETLAEIHQLIALVDESDGDAVAASKQYEESVKVIQSTMPNETWYRTPVFTAAADSFLKSASKLKQRRARAFLREYLASVDAFGHPRTFAYWIANDKLVYALLENGDKQEALERLALDVDRVLTMPKEVIPDLADDFAMVAGRLLKDESKKSALDNRLRDSVKLSRQLWLQAKTAFDKNGVSGSRPDIRARVYAAQLLAYGSLTFELERGESSLIPIEEAVKLGKEGYLSNEEMKRAYLTYQRVLKALGRSEEAAAAGRNAAKLF
ncbi:hypothetical protein GC174_10405 [bacterium]|nr:hypothetical protein [bacterium]